MLLKTASSLLQQALKKNNKSLLHISAVQRQAASNSSSTTNTPEQPPKTVAEKEAPAGETDELSVKLKKLEQDAADFKDKYMRALADAENTRTRMRKQVDDAKVFGIQSFSKDLLEVADVLRLAIENTNPEKKNEKEANSEGVKAIFDGLVMIESRLLKIFEKHNLVQIKPQEGDAFDPNMHDAIFSVPAQDNAKPGTIFKVTKTGFRIHDRVIRAAQVGVTK